MVNTIYYVATEKDLIPTKEDFVESIGTEGLLGFFEAEMPFFIDRLEAYDRDFEPRLLKNSEYFDIKEADGVFEMTLKEDAIKKTRELYTKSLRDYADYIERTGERGYINLKESQVLLKYRDIFGPYNCDMFFRLDFRKDYMGKSLFVSPNSVNTIYDMVDMAVTLGIKKWYIVPVVGCYR